MSRVSYLLPIVRHPISSATSVEPNMLFVLLGIQKLDIDQEDL